MDDGSCVITVPCSEALTSSSLARSIESECCDIGGCNAAVPTACSARCAEIWMPFSIVCSEVVEAQGDVWSEFNAQCENAYYPSTSFGGIGVRCDLDNEWTHVSQACDCGLSGCAGFVTPVLCSLECAAGFEAFMSKCHQQVETTLAGDTASSFSAFLTGCQQQHGYVMHSIEGGH